MFFKMMAVIISWYGLIVGLTFYFIRPRKVRS